MPTSFYEQLRPYAQNGQLTLQNHRFYASGDALPIIAAKNSAMVVTPTLERSEIRGLQDCMPIACYLQLKREASAPSATLGL
jgi:hypothetical protein